MKKKKNKAGLKRVVKTVRTKKGVKRQSFWVSMGDNLRTAAHAGLIVGGAAAGARAGSHMGASFGHHIPEKAGGRKLGHLLGGFAGGSAGGHLGHSVASRLLYGYGHPNNHGK